MIIKNYLISQIKVYSKIFVSMSMKKEKIRPKKEKGGKELKNLLRKVFPKVLDTINDLIERKQYDLAREQIYFAIFKYQKEALSDELKKLTDLLIQIFKQQVEAKEIKSPQFWLDI